MSVQQGNIISYGEYAKSMKKPLLPPAMWEWEKVKERLYSSEKDWQRQIVALSHPHLEEEAGGVVHDLAVVVQVLKPGGRSQLHRHSPWAIHIVMSGEGYTAINGVQYHWKFGDTVLTPAWMYHEHVNTSDTEDAILYSLQNIPALSRINNVFREEPAGLPPKHVLKSDDPNRSFLPPVLKEAEESSNW